MKHMWALGIMMVMWGLHALAPAQAAVVMPQNMRKPGQPMPVSSQGPSRGKSPAQRPTQNTAPLPGRHTPSVRKDARTQCLASLNRIHTLQALFFETQKTRAAQGTVALKRPQKGEQGFGALRLTYTRPSSLDILSRGRTLTVHNKQTNTTETLPVTSTPLSLILRKELKLGHFVKERSFVQEGDQLFWTLEEPRQNHGGYVTLIFHAHSFAFEGWHIRDVYGNLIKVRLGNICLNKPIHPKQFANIGATRALR